MSNQKKNWTRLGASQMQQNAAGGETELLAIASPAEFDNYAVGTLSSVFIASTERSGERVLISAIRDGSSSRLKGVTQSGIVLFDRTHTAVLKQPTIMESKGWILFHTTPSGVDTTAIYSAGTGQLIGTVAVGGAGGYWETQEGKVVAADATGTGTYEMYEISLNSSKQPQSTLLWTAGGKPLAYHPQTDNLVIPLLGTCHELLTGVEVWNFSFTDFNGGVNAPHGALANSAFDEDGNLYNLQLRHTRVVDRMEEKPYLRRLSFPTKISTPQAATEDWTYDLSQSFAGTSNDYPLWGADLQGTLVDVNGVNSPPTDFVLFTNYIIPRNLTVTDGTVWLVMPQMEFSSSSGGVDEYVYFPAILQINPTTGSLIRQVDFPGLKPDAGSNVNGKAHDIYSTLIGANADSGDWVVVNLTIPDGESSNSEPQYKSQLATIQGSTIVGPTPLVWEDPVQDGAQAVTTTLLPYEELENAIITGGAMFYPHREEDDDLSVRKLGTGAFPDSLLRFCKSDRCPPPKRSTANIAGHTKMSAPGVAFNSCDAGNAQASLGSGWHMAGSAKILEGLDGQLEFNDGGGGYEKWTLDSGNYVPVHGDNYVKAVKNVDDTFQLTFPDYSKMNFDTYGRVTSEEDRSGNVTTYTYETVAPADEADARLESISDGFGRVTEFVYGSTELSDRQAVKIIIKEQGGTGSNDREINYEYDSVTDALVKVTAPNGDFTEYVYYPDGKMHKVIEPGGRVAITYTYYSDGRVETETNYISTEFPNGTAQKHFSYDDNKSETTVTTKDRQTTEPDRVMTYTYDLLYNVVKEEDAIGNVTRHKYQDANNPYLRTETIAPNLASTKWTYNSLGNVTQTEDAQGNITNFEYAEDIGPSGDQYKHLLRKVIRPEVSSDGNARYTTEFQYDSLGRVETIIDANLNSTTMEYTSVAGTPKGLIKKTTDRRGNDTDFTYLTNGNLEKVEVETGRSTGVLKTDFEYDGFDSVTKVTNDLGHKVETVYDSLGRATQVTDARSKVSAFRFVDGLLDEMDLPANTASSGAVRTTTMTYDAATRLTQVERDISGSAQEMRVKYGYDGFSQLQALTRIKNGVERSFTFDYDKLGRQTASTDPLSKTSTTAYEPYCTGSASTSARGIRSKTSFDTLCRLTELEVGDPHTDPLEVDNPREIRTFDYDELGRVVQTDQGMPHTFGTAKYGTAKFGTPIVGPDSGIRTYEYDKLDRLVKLTFEDSTTMLYEYDVEGNVTKMTDPNGKITRYEYYADNLLHKAIVERLPAADRVFVYDYDAAGRPKSVVFPTSTGVTAFFNSATGQTDGWNENGQLLNLRYEKGGADIRSFEYAYDDSGNRTQAIEKVGAVTNTWDYEYDWLDRLEKVKKNTVTQSIYAYDASDNRTSLNLQALGNIFTYTYDDADNITEVKKDAVSIETFTKDDDGNMLTRLDKTQTPNITTTYEWDDFNKLIKVSDFDGTTTTVKHQSLYNVNGMRRRKTDAASVTTTEYAEGLSTAVAKAGTASITYINAGGISGFEDSSGNFYYFLQDALGSVRSIIDSTGVVQTSYDFDEYGNLISTPPTGVTSQKTFVGGASVQDETGDTGLYLMGHRWMDSTLGRFINRDPIGFAGGLNLFSYAGNSPVNYVDADGLAPAVLGKLQDFGDFEKAIEAISGLDVEIKGGKLKLASKATIETKYATADSTALVRRLLRANGNFVVFRSSSQAFGISGESWRETGAYRRTGKDAHGINIRSISQVTDDCPSSVSNADAQKVAYSIFVHELKEAEYEFAKGVAFEPAHAAALKLEAKYLSDLGGPVFQGDYGPKDIMDGTGGGRRLKPGETAGRNYKGFKLRVLPSVKIVGP